MVSLCSPGCVHSHSLGASVFWVWGVIGGHQDPWNIFDFLHEAIFNFLVSIFPNPSLAYRLGFSVFLLKPFSLVTKSSLYCNSKRIKGNLEKEFSTALLSHHGVFLHCHSSHLNTTKHLCTWCSEPRLKILPPFFI